MEVGTHIPNHSKNQNSYVRDIQFVGTLAAGNQIQVLSFLRNFGGGT